MPKLDQQAPCFAISEKAYYFGRYLPAISTNSRMRLTFDRSVNCRSSKKITWHYHWHCLAGITIGIVFKILQNFIELFLREIDSVVAIRITVELIDLMTFDSPD